MWNWFLLLSTIISIRSYRTSGMQTWSRIRLTEIGGGTQERKIPVSWKSSIFPLPLKKKKYRQVAPATFYFPPISSYSRNVRKIVNFRCFAPFVLLRKRVLWKSILQFWRIKWVHRYACVCMRARACDNRRLAALQVLRLNTFCNTNGAIDDSLGIHYYHVVSASKRKRSHVASTVKA